MPGSGERWRVARPATARPPGCGRDRVSAKRLIVCVAALTLLAGAVWPLHVLGLRDLRSGRWIFSRVVSPGDAFALGYTHSVKHQPVWDHYSIDERFRIVQTRAIFPGSGFGLPSAAEPGEVHSLLPDGSECIAGMHRPVPQLALRVERAYRNTFVFNDALTLDLSEIMGDGLVDMRVHPSNPIRLCLHILSSHGDHLWHGRNRSTSKS
jgi:hypothetical protein